MARREPRKKTAKASSPPELRGIAKALDAADARFERARVMLGREPDAREAEHEAVLEALKKAMKWLAQRDRSEAEVRERLVKADFDTRAIDRVIDVLRKMGAINDQRHAAGVVERAMRDIPAGDALLAHALERQKVDKDAGAKVMGALASEKTRVKEAAAGVVARLPAGLALAAKWRRAMGALLRKGFDEEAARDALETHLGSLDDADASASGAEPAWDRASEDNHAPSATRKKGLR